MPKKILPKEFSLHPEKRCRDINMLCVPMQNLLASLGKSFGFVVVETGRAVERQKMMVATGKSWTQNSRHLMPEDGTGANASDIMPIGGYDKPFDYEKAHDLWDKLCKEYHDPDWVVFPEARIPKDMGHFGILRTPRKK